MRFATVARPRHRVPIRVESLHHIQLAMPPGGETKARRFYGDALGITELVKPLSVAERGGCWFESGDLRVYLGVEVDFHPARKAHPAFLVSGLAEMAERLRDGGYRVVEDLPLDGYRRVYVDDPFGNRIQLMQPA